MSKNTGEQILVVDDDHAIRWTLREGLQSWGFAAIEAGSVAEGLTQYKADVPDAVLLDIDDDPDLPKLQKVIFAATDGPLLPTSSSDTITPLFLFPFADEDCHDTQPLTITFKAVYVARLTSPAGGCPSWHEISSLLDEGGKETIYLHKDLWDGGVSKTRRLPFVDQIVVLHFAQCAAEWIVKAGFNCVTNEVECFFLNIDNPAAHPAANFMLISFRFENCRTLSR